MDQIPEPLVRNFKDEDTELWVEASVAIGQLGEVARPLLERALSSTDNIHQHRHAWCVLASYLATTQPGSELTVDVVVGRKSKAGEMRDAVEMVAIVSWLQRWLVEAVVEGLRDGDTPLRELLEGLPGFQERQRQALERLEREKEKLAARGNDRAVAAKKRAIAAWADPETPMRELGVSGSLHWDFWVLSSFVAGASGELLEFLGVSVELLVEALARLAAAGRGDRLAVVANLPRLLRTLPYATEAERRRLTDLAGKLTATVPPPQPPDEAGHWLSYVERLRALIEDRDLDIEWSVADALEKADPPAELEEAFTVWDRASKGSRERAAIALARTAESTFCRQTLWREKSRGEQLGLILYSLVMRHPGPGSHRWRRFTLRHRLECVRENIELWKDRNPEILSGLVRLFKVLLYEELRAVSRNSGISLFEVCRRQIAWIRPLVSQWDLEGTLTKDVATIATRALNVCYDNCAARGVDTEEYVRLLYTVLYQISERGLLKDMVQYAQNDAVRRHLQAVSAFEVGRAAGTVDGASSFQVFARVVWGETEGERRAAVVSAVAGLSREPGRTTTILSTAEKDVVRWMIEQRVAPEVDELAGWPDRPGESYRLERADEVKNRVDSEAEEVFAAVHRLADHERAMRDSSASPEAVATATRDTLTELRTLQRLLRTSLPMIEREVVCAALDAEYEDLSRGLAMLTRVVEEEDEEVATRIVTGRIEEDRAPGIRDLVSRWMLRRFMLLELAPRENRVLRFLLDWRGVLLWILTPFVAAGVLHAVVDDPQIYGLPFLLIILANIALLAGYFACRKGMPGGLSRASLLLPQMVGTLFYAIMESFGADEAWATGFLGNPFIRGANLVVFLGASYFFVRHVMLKDHVGGGSEDSRPKTLRRRAMSVLSLGLWQAFALITLFSVLMGSVMTSGTRADWETARESLGPAADALGSVLPHAVEMDFGWVAFIVFPWAILICTVRIFFFGAVFERIMSGRGE